MCCQFHVDEETEIRLSQKLNTGVVLEKGTIKPNAKATILTEGGLCTMKWGFTGKEGGNLLINARAESVEAKPTFRNSFQTSRCIVAASLFYEYDHFKARVGFTLPGSPILFMAGIYREENGLLRFTILTTGANDSVSPFHDRMPLLLEEKELEPYLDNEKEASRLLKAPMPPLCADGGSHQLEFEF